MNSYETSGPGSPDSHAARDEHLFACVRTHGDPRAREELIHRHLPLACRLARRYARSPESIDDLTQVAALGLVKAVDRFDPDRGSAFSSFATPTILGELRRHFRDTRWAVHVPRELQERVQSVARAQDRLLTQLGHSPAPAEVADALNVPVEEVLEAREASSAFEAVSLDAPSPAPDEEGEIARDVGEVDPGFDLVEDREAIQPALALLSARERRALQMRFDLDMTQSEIGERLGISQMHVSRILRGAVSRLRDAAAQEPIAA